MPPQHQKAHPRLSTPLASVPSIHVTLRTAGKGVWSPCLPGRPQTHKLQLGGDHIFGPMGLGLGCASGNQTASTPELHRKARPSVTRGWQRRCLTSAAQASTRPGDPCC